MKCKVDGINGNTLAILRQGGNSSKWAFDAVDGTIDIMTTTSGFSCCMPKPCGEIAEEP
jgi:hypothetical protein